MTDVRPITPVAVCKCGHPKADHDYFGCIHVSCQDTCKRRYGSTEGKP